MSKFGSLQVTKYPKQPSKKANPATAVVLFIKSF